jgi:hypothetical protein
VYPPFARAYSGYRGIAFNPAVRALARREGRRSSERKISSTMPSYYVIPWSLVAMSVVLLGLIYWGSFVEERRNRQAGR